MNWYLIWYITLGLIWTAWLEYYTTKHFELESIGKAWTIQERLFHIILWPINAAIFVIVFIKGLGGDE